MRRKTTILSTAVVLAAASIGLAEIAPKSPAELDKAKVIVVGKINGTFKETTRSTEWENSRGVVEIEVEKVERGEGIKPGDIVFARFWNRSWIKDNNPPPSGSGHYLHDNNTKVRAYLEPGKGAYEILLPNGLVVVEKTPPATKEKPKEKPTASR
jgi:hypothetical protein